MTRTLLTGLALTALAVTSSAQSFPWSTLSTPTSPSARERSGVATDGTVIYLYDGQVSSPPVRPASPMSACHGRAGSQGAAACRASLDSSPRNRRRGLG